MGLASSAAAESVAPKTASASRNLSLDRARTFLTILVLIHHAVIPYTYFGHTDTKSWLGFDAVVLATDSFFMAMFFFLSGLFLWPGLRHRNSPVKFILGRLLRLGLPFLVAAFTIIPMAYYAIALRQTGIGFAAFWWKTITVGPWPSGPLWFLWVLLIFDAIGAVLYRLAPTILDPINRLSARGFDHPAELVTGFVVITAIAYVPLRIYFGAGDWWDYGPFSVQISRVLLYAAYFLVGAGVGAADINRGILSSHGRLAAGWRRWAIASLVSFALLWGMITIKHEILHTPEVLPVWYEACYGVIFVVFSATTVAAILAYFLRVRRSGWSPLDPLHNYAYGIFLIHYLFTLWLQYWLFDVDISAAAKAVTVFVTALALSWATTAVQRQIPGARHVL
jgi:peptidoglycan/LPS O-acetylase OafA/YrhL